VSERHAACETADRTSGQAKRRPANQVTPLYARLRNDILIFPYVELPNG